MIASSSRLTASTPKRGGSAAAGSVTEEQFKAAFDATTPLKISSCKELISEYQKQASILENVNNDWSKRVKALQVLRSILISGVSENPDMISQLYNLLGTALQLSVKDLRSQVCREACITVAFYCEKLGTHFWRVAELLVPTLMQLSQNSAKVMASSSVVACHFVAKYIRNAKLAALLMSFTSSKSRDLRRTTANLIADIITNWEPNVLEKCWPDLNSSIKSSLYDADSEARVFGRQAFEALQSMYPQRAEFLFQELDPAKQRMLTGRSSTASSTHSINSERENLQAPNRGLYAATQQNAFLSKRSTSDLNHSIHSIRKMNLGGVPRVHRPNPVRSAKPSQAFSTLPKQTSTEMSTPVQRRVLPNVVSRTTPSAPSVTAQKASSKSSSQPGSRSTSPNKFRAPRSHIPASHVTERKPTNGTANSAFSVSRTANVASSKADFTKALRNVDMQSRSVRQNTVRNFDDGVYGLSPSTGFINRHPGPNRFSDSPNGEAGGYGARYSNGKGATHNNNLSNDKWLYKKESLVGDREAQMQYVDEICNVLLNNTDHNCDEMEVEAALSAFTHVIRDGALTYWDDYFNSIFLALVQSISHQNNFAVKLSALRALKELCINQPKRVEQKPEMAMINVLNAHNCEDATVVRVAEECGAVLANNLPVDVCRKNLLTVIDDEKTSYHQLAGAIKMLSRVLEKLSVDEVRHLLPEIVGRMMKCYENSQSMVRRASIICLVAISNSIGIEMLKPHLNASTLKLVEVYRDRMTKGK